MTGFWRRLSPRRAIDDFANEWRQPNPYRWRVLGLSVAATFSLMIVLIPESEPIPPARPDVTYITTFAPDRTDDEIVATNLENQKRKDALEAERAAREERRREAARALGRATGLDVDALERQYSDDPPAEPARQAQPAE